MTEPPRRLVLLRHAKAEYSGFPDSNRVLSPAGRRQAAEVGISLASGGLVPDLVLCSSAVRTQQTCELVVDAWGGASWVVVTDDLYGAGVADVVEIVGEAPPQARTVLVVGHEPVMSGVASVLAGDGSSREALTRVRSGVPTATYSVLELPGAWDDLRPGGAVLADVVLPARRL